MTWGARMGCFWTWIGIPSPGAVRIIVKHVIKLRIHIDGEYNELILIVMIVSLYDPPVSNTCTRFV